MDNRQRAINYLRQNYEGNPRIFPATPEMFAVAVDHAMDRTSPYEHVSLDQLLTPAQMRRIKHKRAGQGVHRQHQRERRQSQLLRKIAHWTELRDVLDADDE